MSRRSCASKHRSSSALILAAVFAFSSFLPALSESEDLDSWINESGCQKQVKSPSIKEVLESKRPQAANRPGEMSPIYDSSIGTDSSDKTAPKRISQAVSPVANSSLAKAINAAAPGNAPTPLLKGQVTYCIPSGTPLKLKLATVPLPQLKSEIRDMEGNLRPAQTGEVITAKITEDIYVDDNKVIPEGTIFHGKVSKIYPPRHVGRPGHLELAFDSFTTPDGRKFAFKAEASNFKESTPKSKLKGAGVVAAHAAGGAALGALVAYKVFGPQSTIAMHGYNIAGGAAIGAAGGIAWALWRRGPHAVLEPGDEFAMSINKDLLIPAASKPTVKAPPASLPGFEMEVLSKKKIKDGFGGYMFRVESVITNQTHKKLSSIDLFLEDDLGNRCPVSPDIDEEAQEIFYINPLSRTRIVCTFAVQFPKLKHKIIWLDHHNHSIIFEQKL